MKLLVDYLVAGCLEGKDATEVCNNQRCVDSLAVETAASDAEDVFEMENEMFNEMEETGTSEDACSK